MPKNLNHQKDATPITAVVGARFTADEIVRIDKAAQAAHLDRSSYIRRVLKERAIKFYPMEVLLSEAVTLFCTMRVSVELNRIERLTEAFDRLDGMIDRLEKLATAEARQ